MLDPSNTHVDARHQIISDLVARFGTDIVVGPDQDLAKYLRDWSGDHQGHTIALLRPRDVAQVSALMGYCHDQSIAVVPQGGNTGLVSGAIDPAGGGVVLSLERLNRLRNVNPLNLTAVAEAGCILSTVKAAVEAAGCYFPVSLGAQGSAQIGGIVSTNAGGTNVVKYGMTSGNILGLEVVLPDGTIWSNLSGLRKDNRGPDLTQMFVGGEGAFGVVTAACLKLSPVLKTREMAYIGCAGFDVAMGLLHRLRRECHEFLSGFEVMSNECLPMARLVYPDIRFPVAETHLVHVLIELSSVGAWPLRDTLEALLVDEMEAGHIDDAVVAQNRSQAETFWKIREGLVEGHAANGFHVRSDVSVEINLIPELAAKLGAMLGRLYPDWLPQTYGHAGDGNIHFNAIPPQGLDAETCRRIGREIEAEIFNIVDQLKGSFSAEHGIGRSKRDRFVASADPVQTRLLSGVKQVFDPDGVMNPGCLVTTKESRK